MRRNLVEATHRNLAAAGRGFTESADGGEYREFGSVRTATANVPIPSYNRVLSLTPTRETTPSGRWSGSPRRPTSSPPGSDEPAGFLSVGVGRLGHHPCRPELADEEPVWYWHTAGMECRITHY